MSKDDQGRDLQKHTLHLFDGDYDELARLFPAAKPAKLIRHMVRDLIKRTKGATPDVSVTLPEMD
jgi:hypothetical protein